MDFSITEYNSDKKTFSAFYLIERYNQKSIIIRNVFEINPYDPLMQMYNKNYRKPIYRGKNRIIEIFSSAIVLPISQITMFDTEYPEVKKIEMPYWLYKKNSSDLQKDILTVQSEPTIYRPAFSNVAGENINFLKLYSTIQGATFES
jgi:hypothetical protein